MLLDTRSAIVALTTMLALGCDAPRDIAADSVANTAPGASSSASLSSSASAAKTSAPPAKPVDAPAKVSISGTLDKTKLSFTSGYAQLERGVLTVVLADRALDCFAKPGRGVQALEFKIPPSRDGRFFTGSTFSVPYGLKPGPTFYGASASMITVTAANAKQGGQLSFSGTFAGTSSTDKVAVDLAGSASVPICIAPGEKPLELAEPTGDKLEVLSAAAYRNDDGPAGSVGEIWLFTNLPGTCASSRKPNRFTFVDLMDVGLPVLKGVKATGPQPVRPMFHPTAPDEFATGGSADPTGYGEIVWDDYPAKSGKVRGRMQLWSFTGEAGTSAEIEATLCP